MITGRICYFDFQKLCGYLESDRGVRFFFHLSDSHAPDGHFHFFEPDKQVKFEKGEKNGRHAAIHVRLIEAPELPSREVSRITRWDSRNGYGFAERQCVAKCPIHVKGKNVIAGLDKLKPGRLIQHSVGIYNTDFEALDIQPYLPGSITNLEVLKQQ